jgi:hypothetical protein
VVCPHLSLSDETIAEATVALAAWNPQGLRGGLMIAS